VVFARIAALLKEKIGLDAESIGVASIERVVRERLAACGLEDVQVYWKHLSASEQELQELIEAIVIRYRHHLLRVARSVGPAERQIARAKKICAGCAVRSECLEFALSHDQVYGIWGGTTPEDRQRERRRKRRAAAAARRRVAA